jgi:uncharacterized repeat protein (TIGR01451 family)
VVITDTLPSGVTLMSAIASAGSCSGTTTVTCNFTGASTTAVIVVTPTTPGLLTNVASVSGAQFDPNPSNNTASVGTTVIEVADLSVTKADAPDPVAPGGNVTYTVVVTNQGTLNATGVFLTDSLPAGATFVSATSSQGVCVQAGGTVNCSLGNLASGASATVTITVTATMCSMINTVSVTGNEPDLNKANNVAVAQTVVSGCIDLSVTKTDFPDPVSVGGNLTYRLTVTNAGNVSATNVVLTDILPAEVTLVSVSSTGLCVGTTTVTCNLGTFGAGVTASSTIIVVTPTSSTTPVIVNTASVTGTGNDPNLANNTDTEGTTLTGPPGEIRGTKWNDLDGDGIKDAGEPGVSGVTICISQLSTCIATDSSGNYRFMGVTPGVYTVYEAFQSGFIPTTPTSQSVSVASLQIVDNVNFGNRVITLFATDVTVPSSTGTTSNGTPTQTPGTDLVIRKTISVCTPEGLPKVTLTLSNGSTRIGNMMNIGGNLWQVVFAPPFPGGTTSVRMDIDCPPAGIGGEDAFQIGDIIFIDPSGAILNACTGGPVPGATATLLKESSPGSGIFVIPSTADHLPVTNPQTTGADGKYGWMVVPGKYKVRAAKAGLITAESSQVTIPPPVTGLNITLLPSGACPAADTTPPQITPNVTGTLGNNGWFVSNVTVSWSVTDAQSTVSSSTGCGTSTVTSDTPGVTFTCTATSGGGTASNSVTVKRDATPPTITAVRTPGPNINGWNNTDVFVGFTCNDGMSGIASCTPDQTIMTEILAMNLTGTAVDLAGNSSSTTVGPIKIDKTAPNSPTASVTPTPNAAGWNNTTPVNVSFTSNGDSGTVQSGVASCAGPTTLTSETAGTGVSGTCTDAAGNTSTTTSVTVKIDKTAPNAPTASVNPTPNLAGWNNSTPVTVSFASAGDAGAVQSGVASCAGPTTLTSETAGTAITGTCTDAAGNTSTATSVTIKIDKTPPTITGSRSPGPNANGWNNTNVTVSYSASDVLSGLDLPASDLGNDVLSAEGANQSATGTAVDKAGNSASATVSGIKIDKTPPTVACNVNPNRLWPPNHKMVPITASVTVTDTLSGPVGFSLTAVTSNEPDDGLGDGDMPNDIQGWSIGTPDTSGSLRAERSGKGTDRIYTLSYTASDMAGNSTPCSTTVTVPHDQGK